MAWFIQEDAVNKGSEHEQSMSPDVEVIPEEHRRVEKIGKALGEELRAPYKARGIRTILPHPMADDPAFPFWHPHDFPPLRQGWKWPIPEKPFRDQLKRKTGSIMDIVSTSFNTYAISRKVIDLIESIEPGVHQYLPYEQIQPDGSIHPDQRWLLNCCSRLQAVDIAKSNVVIAPDWPAEFGDINNQTELYVRKDVIEGKALWYEYRYLGTSGQILLTDRFWSALKEHGYHGWQPGWGPHSNHICEI